MTQQSFIRGLHHVTAIASGAQANLDFYTRVQGLRLVKRTVNFDAPDTYHFYYGDAVGSPGSLLTFFPFADAAPGRATTSNLPLHSALPPGAWLASHPSRDWARSPNPVVRAG